MEGGEGCDDGNKMPFDGCSSDCQIEPDCSGTSCASACGDGLVFGNEECDDGNHANGDGCSADCKIESGWNCTQPPVGNKIMVPVVYRDFRFHNPSDFEAGVVGAATASVGMVNPDLDKDGKPVYTGLTGAAIHVESQSTFSQWYRNTDGVNHATPAKMALWDNGQGGYVNRYGANGEQWNLTQTAYFCGTKGLEILDADGQAIPCTCSVSATTDCDTLLAAGEQMLKCYLDRYYGVTWEATFLVAKMDGNPLFFPVDDDSFTPASELTAARIPPLYDATMTWPFDVDDAGNNRLHNFSFTSEVRYWFKYEAGKTYQLDFVGDDDVWVFINRKLAVDMGGIHMPVSGSITLDATTAARLGGLKDGKLYEIAVFQAERQTSGSSYKLTLTGFNTASSQCSPL
jgi:fibro-slime domain-containing protein